MLTIATKDKLFQFNGDLYKQIDGVAMCSPLGPLLANTFMCFIEERELRYKRYLIKTMLDRANRLSSSPDLFWKEFQDLRTIFLKLKYPEKLIDSIFQSFHVSKT